ncbi:hypothetical protein PAHAL_2G279100 [Panicum hallii]|uniref:Uncharacterized protein n=1 Tax=Panicum hallii TaxID=206008 RepID=A0A2S3H009_9POAL|nr:hypothetical protein PAHAL_2G279100 [Panicum hallii]
MGDAVSEGPTGDDAMPGRRACAIAHARWLKPAGGRTRALGRAPPCARTVTGALGGVVEGAVVPGASPLPQPRGEPNPSTSQPRSIARPHHGRQPAGRRCAAGRGGSHGHRVRARPRAAPLVKEGV